MYGQVGFLNDYNTTYAYGRIFVKVLLHDGCPGIYCRFVHKRADLLHIVQSFRVTIIEIREDVMSQRQVLFYRRISVFMQPVERALSLSEHLPDSRQCA